MKTLVVSALLSVCLATILRVPKVKFWFAGRYRLVTHVMKSVAVILLVAFAAATMTPTLSQRIAFPDEMTVLSTAAAYLHGQPIYPPLQGPAEYGLLYGPAAFLLYTPLAAMHIEKLGMYQAWAAVALLASFVLLARALRTWTSRTGALLCLAGYAAFLARSEDSIWNTKGDPWILLFECLGIWAVSTRSAWTAAFVIAVAGSCMSDIKITTLALAFFPCLLLAVKTGRGGPAWFSAAGIGLLLPTPFLLPRISLANYRVQIQLAAHHGLSVQTLHSNLVHIVALFVPFITVVWWTAHCLDRHQSSMFRRRSVLVHFLLASAVCLFTGSKNGAGTWHLLPIVPYLVLLAGTIIDLEKPMSLRDHQTLFSWQVAAPTLTVFLLLLASFPILYFGGRNRFLPKGQPHVSMSAVQHEVQRIVNSYPHDTLQMGYSDSAHYSLTFTRQVLQVRGFPLIIDANVRNEAKLEHLPMPPSLVQSIAACHISLWILPRGGEPFSMTTPYFDTGTIAEPDLFPSDFKQAFFEHAHRIKFDSPYFDLWACQTGSPKE